MRKTIFAEIHTKIEKHNAQKGANFEMAHNIFSVMVIFNYLIRDWPTCY